MSSLLLGHVMTEQELMLETKSYRVLKNIQFYPDNVLSFEMDNREYKVSLRPNDEFYSKSGETNHHYTGFVQNYDKSEASVTIANDGLVSGFITISPSDSPIRIQSIETKEKNTITVAYSESDVIAGDSNEINCASKSPIKSPLVKRDRTEYSQPSQFIPTDTNRSKWLGKRCRVAILADGTFSSAWGGKAEATKVMYEMLNEADQFFFNTFNFGLQIPYAYAFDVNERSPFNENFATMDALLERLSNVVGTYPELIPGFDQNTEQLCYAMLFTHRDLQAILGQSHTYQICASEGHNTGIINSNLAGKRIAPRLLAATTKHELSHAVGTKHDGQHPGRAQCTREGYLMTPVLTLDLPHLNQLSPCSKQEMLNNLDRQATCFV